MSGAQSGHLHTLTDVGIKLPSFTEVINILSFQAGYNSSVVIAGTTFLGIAAGIIASGSWLSISRSSTRR